MLDILILGGVALVVLSLRSVRRFSRLDQTTKSYLAATIPVPFKGVFFVSISGLALSHTLAWGNVVPLLILAPFSVVLEAGRATWIWNSAHENARAIRAFESKGQVVEASPSPARERHPMNDFDVPAQGRDVS